MQLLQCRYQSLTLDNPIALPADSIQLILISGYPSSGKTYRSNQLVDFFNAKIRAATEPHISRLNVVHVNDQTLGLNKDVYGEARPEKDARAAEYSAVKRALGRDSIVIADGLNYIKGFRYQLYCEAKAVQTPSCVVSAASRDPTAVTEDQADLLQGPHRDTRREMQRDECRAVEWFSSNRSLSRRCIRQSCLPL